MTFPTHWIFLRGLSRNSKHWGSFPKAFEKEFKVEVKCIDLPGFGLLNKQSSPISVSGVAASVVEGIEAYSAEKNLIGEKKVFGILGISLGGMVAFEIAGANPSLVSHLVLINSSLGALSKPQQRMQILALPKLIAAASYSDSKREETILSVTCNDPKIRLKLHNSWCLAAKKYPYTAANVLRQLAAAASYRKLPPIAASTLVLSSKEDRLVSPKCSQALADHYEFPIFTHSWVGHDLVMDDPGWALEKIKNVLATPT